MDSSKKVGYCAISAFIGIIIALFTPLWNIFSYSSYSVNDYDVSYFFNIGKIYRGTAAFLVIAGSILVLCAIMLLLFGIAVLKTGDSKFYTIIKIFATIAASFTFIAMIISFVAPSTYSSSVICTPWGEIGFIMVIPETVCLYIFGKASSKSVKRSYVPNRYSTTTNGRPSPYGTAQTKPAETANVDNIVLTATDPMDQILELKQLLDEGKITQEQYNKKITTLL